MKKPIQAISLLLLVALILSACSLGLDGGSEEQGYANFAVSRISPAFLSSIDGGARALDSQSRTFLVADRVEFTLFLDGAYHSYWEVYPSLVNSPDVPAISSKTLEPGDYSVSVKVYNLLNSAALQYTASGTATFGVYEGMTSQVDIFCVPVSPTYITEGTASAAFTLPYPFLYTGTETSMAITATGSEQWYAFYPSTATTRVLIDPAGLSQASLTVAPFLLDGTYLGNDLDLFAAPGESLDFFINTIPGQRCYLGVMDGLVDGGMPAADRSFTVLVESVPDIQLTSGANWFDSAIGAYSGRWFYFDLPMDEACHISLNDSSDGDGTESGDVWIDVYEDYYSTDRSYIWYLAGADDAYTAPIEVAPAAMWRRIWIQAWGYSSGSFSLKVDQWHVVDVVIE